MSKTEKSDVPCKKWHKPEYHLLIKKLPPCLRVSPRRPMAGKKKNLPVVRRKSSCSCKSAWLVPSGEGRKKDCRFAQGWLVSQNLGHLKHPPHFFSPIVVHFQLDLRVRTLFAGWWLIASILVWWCNDDIFRNSPGDPWLQATTPQSDEHFLGEGECHDAEIAIFFSPKKHMHLYRSYTSTCNYILSTNKKQPATIFSNLPFQPKTADIQHLGVFKNRGVSPQMIHLFIEFSIIFTIHFGVPVFLETAICWFSGLWCLCLPSMSSMVEAMQAIDWPARWGLRPDFLPGGCPSPGGHPVVDPGVWSKKKWPWPPGVGVHDFARGCRFFQRSHDYWSWDSVRWGSWQLFVASKDATVGEFWRLLLLWKYRGKVTFPMNF